MKKFVYGILSVAMASLILGTYLISIPFILHFSGETDSGKSMGMRIALSQIGRELVAHTVSQADVHVVNPQKQTADGQPNAILVLSQAMKRSWYQK